MTIVRAYSSFEELPPAHRRLFEERGGTCFFHSLPWFKNYVKTVLGPQDRVRIFAVESDDGQNTPLAILPMCHTARAAGPWNWRTLSSLSNYYTALFSSLRANSGEPWATDRIAAAIADDTPNWDVVNLKPLDADSPEFGDLVTSFRRAGWVVQTYFCFGNWYLSVRGRSYREYLESLPAALRNTVNRKTKKLEQSGKARIVIHTGAEGLTEAVNAYQKVYAASWKWPEPYPEFMPGLISTCAEQGWLRLGLVYFDSEPAAAQLWIVQNGVASIYKLAYDERLTQFSVGTVLTAQLMRHALDVDRVQEVDYLHGDDAYKRDWMSHRRERWGIIAFNPRTVRGALATIRHVGGRAVKRGLLGLFTRPRAEENA